MIKERKLNISKNDLCPCQSGEKYKDCCRRKDINYYTLGKNYNGIEVVFDIKKTHNIYDQIKKFGVENIFSLKEGEGFSISKGEEFLKNTYALMDSGISNFEKYAPCKKGCGKCCSLYLECTAIEAETIRRYIVKNRSLKEIKELDKKFKSNYQKSKELLDSLNHKNKVEIAEKYFNLNIPCAFLNDMGACSIYEKRPAICRSFIVFSSNLECHNQSQIIKPNLPVAYIGNLVIEGISINTNRYKKLSFIGENRIKAEKKSLAQWFKNGFLEVL